ncbi:type I-E CRISPR-associated protein Cse2/CasB [Marinivivus vitaminiproducens]|uniref:type I-E CRISPR-associated protein Cse2/CasB n=1 Tax=Marinivivus vitaminiproducens TaxID=3035935 RepID=UPI0027A74D75|nr:type I-E CRISPR-associated protein Cse2/CasB [Geminicoccaceae bacterium SCSIO 64248]
MSERLLSHGAAALAWWQGLQPGEVSGEGKRRPGDSAALARLRRAGTPAEALAEEATLALFTRLGFGSDEGDRRLMRVATVAAVLAHVREHRVMNDRRRNTAIGMIGRTSLEDADSAILKPLRFKRLLAARTDEDLMRVMRRLVLLAERKTNVADLATSILYWGERVRVRWAFDYYAAGHAAPASGQDTSFSSETSQ